MKPGSIDTGAVVASDEDFPILLYVQAYDESGKTVYSGTRRIPPRGQAIFLLSEVEAVSRPFRGTLYISSGYPVATSGFRARYNERGDLLLAPLSHIYTYDPWEFVFPFIVAGAGYATDFILLGGSGALNLYSQTGELLKIGVNQR
jgi:hypothetical protein